MSAGGVQAPGSGGLPTAMSASTPLEGGSNVVSVKLRTCQAQAGAQHSTWTAVLGCPHLSLSNTPFSHCAYVVAMQQESTEALVPRSLFGGAITLSLPQRFLDVSDFRPVPDNQEACASADSGCCTAPQDGHSRNPMSGRCTQTRASTRA